MSTFTQKLVISSVVALVFMFISMPYTYKLTNSFLTKKSNLIYNPTINCHTGTGHLLHTAIFFLIVFLQMFISESKYNNKFSFGIKLKYALYSTLIFFLISNKVVYKLTRKLISNKISNINGCPTILGVVIHSLIYTSILISVMYLPDYC